MRNSNVRLAMFQISVITAASSLLGLRLALHDGAECERALSHAVHARRSIVETYDLWSRLEERGDGAEWLAELRHFGHDVLASRLHVEPVVYATDTDTELKQQASRIALLATLWKIADALDSVEAHVN
jgi:hypothetical protein